MTRTVGKYILGFSNNRSMLDGIFTLQLPTGSTILALREQYNLPRIWVEYDTANSNTLVTRQFRIFQTGDLIQGNPSLLKYVGTFQIDNGNLDFHVYEMITGGGG